MKQRKSKIMMACGILIGATLISVPAAMAKWPVPNDAPAGSAELQCWRVSWSPNRSQAVDGGDLLVPNVRPFFDVGYSIPIQYGDLDHGFGFGFGFELSTRSHARIR